MLFTITRTSQLDGDVPPCPDARIEDYLHVDRRTNLPRRRWVAEVADILAFANLHGRLVVSGPDPDGLPARPTIEIYDGWRE